MVNQSNARLQPTNRDDYLSRQGQQLQRGTYSHADHLAHGYSDSDYNPYSDSHAHAGGDRRSHSHTYANSTSTYANAFANTDAYGYRNGCS